MNLDHFSQLAGEILKDCEPKEISKFVVCYRYTYNKVTTDWYMLPNWYDRPGEVDRDKLKKENASLEIKFYTITLPGKDFKH